MYSGLIYVYKHPKDGGRLIVLLVHVKPGNEASIFLPKSLRSGRNCGVVRYTYAYLC